MLRRCNQPRTDQEVKRALLGQKLNEDDFVFSHADGSPPNLTTVTHTFSKVAKRAGLSYFRLHNLRHIHATILLKTGTHPRVVRERLGYSSIAITLDICSYTVSDMQKAAERLNTLLLKTVGIRNVGKMSAKCRQIAHLCALLKGWWNERLQIHICRATLSYSISRAMIWFRTDMYPIHYRWCW